MFALEGTILTLRRVQYKNLCYGNVVFVDMYIVNDIRNFVFELAEVSVYGPARAGNRNLLCCLL